ncbi:hypothetical protein [Nocardia higoensis]|uniref:hypothetical protein n=1 Tax=Nocardia higoensis TaxID=228599 RepID=UPI001FE11882|nr:hypothetical protein [Nocardia higoensis]
MLGTRMIQGRFVAASAAVALAATMAGGAVAAAAPGSSTGSTVIDTGIGLGSSVLDFGSSVLGSGSGSFGNGAPQTQQCNQSTESGGEGVTETVHQLGTSGPTSFVLSYETENVPDRIQVFYQGTQVADTGYVGDNTNEGTGSVVVHLPAGTASSVLVRVTGLDDTVWTYTVHCPS